MDASAGPGSVASGEAAEDAASAKGRVAAMKHSTLLKRRRARSFSPRVGSRDGGGRL
jgi:hypothetical protein